MRFLPFALVLAYLVVAAGWRAWLQQRRFGGHGLALFHDRRRWLFDTGALLLPVVLLADAWTAPRAAPPFAALGVALVLVSLVLLVRAQLALGRSWRIGIEPDARPGLVTGGVYRYSRNPIFASGAVGLVGLALLLPSALTLVIVIAAALGVHRQVLDEERWLAAAYPDEYAGYRARVPRYFPFTRPL